MGIHFPIILELPLREKVKHELMNRSYGDNHKACGGGGGGGGVCLSL